MRQVGKAKHSGNLSHFQMLVSRLAKHAVGARQTMFEKKCRKRGAFILEKPLDLAAAYSQTRAHIRNRQSAPAAVLNNVGFGQMEPASHGFSRAAQHDCDKVTDLARGKVPERG